MKNLGITALVVSLIMTVLTGFNVITKKIVDLGSVKINREDNKPVYWSPMIEAHLVIAKSLRG